METFIALLNTIMPYISMPAGIVLLILVAIHAGKLMGLKPALEMLGVGWVVAYVLEEIGVHTGIIYGDYYFTKLMGPKLDVIPVALPCLWVVLLYIAWVMTNLILDGTPYPEHFTHGRILAGAVLASMVVTTLDLNADPFAVDNGWWVWIDKGAYFGVPVHNFIGWFIVAFISYMIHGYQLRHSGPKNLETASIHARRWSIAPLAVYAVAWIAFMVINFDQKLGLVTFYLYGIPLFAACWRWAKWYQATKKESC